MGALIELQGPKHRQVLILLILLEKYRHSCREQDFHQQDFVYLVSAPRPLSGEASQQCSCSAVQYLSGAASHWWGLLAVQPLIGGVPW